MRFLKLTIAYDGTDYCGWQIQDNDIAIQQRLEEGWQRVTGESIRITASGRTDGGVHAEGQVCSLATETEIPTANLLRALNTQTPFDITVLSVEEVAAGFHAIRDAIGKTYRYQIQYGRILDPLGLRYWWFVPWMLDVEAMQVAADWLVGTHDFLSFQSKGADRSTTIRTITDLSLKTSVKQTQIDIPRLTITISADGFLYKMVRNIVGSLVRVGQGRESTEWLKWVLAQKNRDFAGQAAPANGLFLQAVEYAPLWLTPQLD